MEIVIFFTFIAVCAMALLWASRKTRSEDELARKERIRRNQLRSEKLATPRDTVLAHGEQVWQNRRQHATSGVIHTNEYAPRSETTGMTEYDGWSRRDRHHVRDMGAQVKEDRPEEIFTVTAVEIGQDKQQEASKKAAG